MFFPLSVPSSGDFASASRTDEKIPAAKIAAGMRKPNLHQHLERERVG
jgi:hypothetical protein